METDLTPSDALVSFTRLMLSTADEWKKAREKSKIPKPKLDVDVLTVLVDVIEKRLKEYPTSLEVCPSLCFHELRASCSLIDHTQDDERILDQTTMDGLSLHKRNALIVRVGEKRILSRMLTKLKEMRQGMGGAEKSHAKKRKGVEETQEKSKGKKAKR
jgi:SET domain-containing protein 6